MFNDLDQIEIIKKYTRELQSRFNAKLNAMRMPEALKYLSGLRVKGWIVPSAVWAMCALIILSGAITSLNWAVLAVILFMVNFVNLQYTVMVNQYIYNLTTRRADLDPHARENRLWEVRRQATLQNCYAAGASGALPFAFCICPYLEFLRLNPTAQGWTTGTIDSIVGSPLLIRGILLSLPIVMTLLDYRAQKATEEIYKDVISRNLATKRYNDPELQNLLTGYHQEESDPDKSATDDSSEKQEVQKKEGKLIDPEPYVTIGKSIKTGDIVELAPVQRKQNCIYFGPVGSGKTSTIFIPQIKQDIDHYLRFVRDYPKICRDPSFMKKKNNPAAHHLNGFAVVETSNDLCTSVYKLAKKMGVPDDKIVWFDPSNPSTPSLNLLRGPIPIVTENISNIINGVKTENSDFFQQSERTHLKMYITLLKMSAVIEQKTPDFSDLMDLYSDVYLVLEKMQYLEQYVRILKGEVEAKKDKYEELSAEDSGASPAEIKKANTDYLEIDDKYKVASDTLKWFKNSIKPKMFGAGMLKHKTGDRVGQIIYEDINDQNIAGLRNTLNDLAQNTLLRRVLFRDSGDFSIDDFLYNGGIMLCNTAKTELQDSLSKTVGQVYMICLATAAFRRKPDTAPMFTIYADEFPDFIYGNFTSFLAQARKYNISIVIAAQTFAQIARDYGDEFAETIMSNMLTRGAFGDLSPGDAKRLEPFFGERYRTSEDVNNQDVGALSGDLTNKRSLSMSSAYEPNISAADLMQLQKFNIAVRHPDMQGSVMFDIIKTKYLTDDDILSDPNIFDTSSERDEDAYETMIHNQHHGNPDLDEVDSKIFQKIHDGEIQVDEINMDNILYEADKNGAAGNDNLNGNRGHGHGNGQGPKQPKGSQEERTAENKALHKGTIEGSGGNNRERTNNVVSDKEKPVAGLDELFNNIPSNGEEPYAGQEAKQSKGSQEECDAEDNAVDGLSDFFPDDPDNPAGASDDGEENHDEDTSYGAQDDTSADDEAHDDGEESHHEDEPASAQDDTSDDAFHDDEEEIRHGDEPFIDEAKIEQMMADNELNLSSKTVMQKLYGPLINKIENSKDFTKAEHANELRIVNQLEELKLVLSKSFRKHLPEVLAAKGKPMSENDMDSLAMDWPDKVFGMNKRIEKHKTLANAAKKEEEESANRFAELVAHMNRLNDD